MSKTNKPEEIIIKISANRYRKPIDYKGFISGTRDVMQEYLDNWQMVELESSKKETAYALSRGWKIVGKHSYEGIAHIYLTETIDNLFTFFGLKIKPKTKDVGSISYDFDTKLGATHTGEVPYKRGFTPDGSEVVVFKMRQKDDFIVVDNILTVLAIKYGVTVDLSANLNIREDYYTGTENLLINFTNGIDDFTKVLEAEIFEDDEESIFLAPTILLPENFDGYTKNSAHITPTFSMNGESDRTVLDHTTPESGAEDLKQGF